jgi:TPR repeat protein
MALPEFRMRVTKIVVVVALLAAAQVATAATAGTASTDPLEPAKASIRLKDYAGATARLAGLVQAGNPQAQYLLGTIYLAGLAPAPDELRARQLFETAAAKGEPRAAYAMAALLATDDPPDPVNARKWLAKAAAAGDVQARELVKRGALPLEFRPQDELKDTASPRCSRRPIATTQPPLPPWRHPTWSPRPISSVARCCTTPRRTAEPSR